MKIIYDCRIRLHRNAMQFIFVATVFLVSGFDAWAEGFFPVSSMSTGRENHTATLIQDGTVLIAGGYYNGFLNSAEIYDPWTNVWKPTGTLATVRASHTATLLRNGKVLVAGGYYFDGAYHFVNSAEIYDPVSNTWSQAGSLTTGRYNHTATLLQDGKVLVAGGEIDTSPYSLNTAELYDPMSNTWSAAGTLATARNCYSATLLSNGKVLVAGGNGNGGPGGGVQNSSELYDPSSNTWGSAASLAVKRFQHTATILPNGKVLVAGGTGSDVGTLTSCELYDPMSNTWSAAGSLTTAHEDHTATTLLNGNVLVIGGHVNPSGYLSISELYDPISNTWSVAGYLGTGRFNHTATLLGSGKVLITGGFNYVDFVLSSAELYESGPNPAIPNINSPSATNAPGNIYNTSVLTISWDQVTGADGYEVYVSQDDGTGTYPTLVFDSSTNGLITDTTFTLPNGILPVDGLYRTNMRAKNANGYSSYSAVKYFVVSTSTAIATRTVAANANAVFSASVQSVTLTATVTTMATTVNEGTVTFQLLNGPTIIGSAVTSSTVANGGARVTYPLPAGLATGAYTINAAYSGTTNYIASSDTSKNLTVGTSVNLPLTIGVLTINGDQLTSLGRGKYEVNGHVTINGSLQVSAPIVCDFDTTQVSFTGNLIHGAVPVSDYANLLTGSAVIIDAATGTSNFALSSLNPGIKVAGLSITFNKFIIINNGVQFDFSMAIPNLSKTANGEEVVAIVLQGVTIDSTVPYFHLPNSASIDINNVYMKDSGFGLKRLELSYSAAGKSFSGAVILGLPGGGSVDGSAAIISGQLNMFLFGWDGNEQLFAGPLTTVGVPDGIFLTSLHGGVDHLTDGQSLSLLAGTLTDDGFVDVPGLGLTWGLGVGQFSENLVTVNGAGKWNTQWDMTVAGKIILAQDVVNSGFNISDCQFNYSNKSQILSVMGKLDIADIVAERSIFTTSFNKDNRYFQGNASADLTIPSWHWGWIQTQSVPLAKGEAGIICRTTPAEKYYLYADASTSIPFTPWGSSYIGYYWDLSTGEHHEADASVIATVTGRQREAGRLLHRIATNSTFELTSDAGINGLIVRLKYESGAPDFSILLPNGKTLSPASADGVNVVYGKNPNVPETVYLLKSATDGKYTVALDDTGIGAWSVVYMSPNPAPSLLVTPVTDQFITTDGRVNVSFTALNVASNAHVRSCVNSGTDWGGGTQVASADSLSQTTFTVSLTGVPPGDYNIGVELDVPGSYPIHAYAPGKILVRGENIPLITSGSIIRGIVGRPLSYTVTTEVPADSITITGLPAGLSYENSQISGIPSAGGASTIVVIAVNANGADQKTLTIAIVDPSNGEDYASIDSDGDGVPDELESLFGTSPSNPASKPNFDTNKPQSINKVKVSIALNVKKSAGNSVMISGIIPIMPSTTLKGAKVSLLVGGVPRTFTLDTKASAKTATGDSFKLQLSKLAKGKATATVTATFTAKISGSDVASNLIDERITTTTTVTKSARSLTTWLVIDQAVFKTKTSLQLTAKKDVSAIAK